MGDFVKHKTLLRDFIVFILQVENCIAEETDRAMRYLDKDTKNKLLSVRIDYPLILFHLNNYINIRN